MTNVFQLDFRIETKVEVAWTNASALTLLSLSDMSYLERLQSKTQILLKLNWLIRCAVG